MNSSRTFAACMLAVAATLSGCASTSRTSPYAAPTASSSYGTIDSIQVTQADNGTSGGGAVVGGVLGALVGHQVGSGSGRTAATVAGAAGGAYVGNQVEANRNAQTRDAYQINVRLDSGGVQSVVQDSVTDLRVGQRVRIIDGRVYRY